MQRPTDHAIKILNSLIETTLDSADGYSQAATSAADARYRELFQEWANDRRRVVTDLQGQLRVLGGTLEGNDSRAAADRRMFRKLRDFVALGDESVVDEVARGEEFIRTMYEEALDDEKLSTDVRNAVIRAYISVQSGHERARTLRQPCVAELRLLS